MMKLPSGRGVLLGGLLLLLGLTAVFSFQWKKPVPVKTKTILGYYTVDEAADQKSYESLASYGSYLNHVSIVPFVVSATGAIEKTVPTSGLQLAKSKNIKAFATITNLMNDTFDPNLAHRILSDSYVRQTVLFNILKLVTENGYQGVNVDFENVLAEDRSLYTQFINELADILHSYKLELIVSVMAKTEDSPTSSWIGAFDYALLGQAADRLQIMTYDEHDLSGEPGPVASFSWVEDVIKYALSQISPNKILLGLAAYGYDWDESTNSGSKAVPWVEIPDMLSTYRSKPKWDATEQSPSFSYTDVDGSTHIVWYENTDSIRIKTKLVNRYHLCGVAVWSLGQENESFWKAVFSGLM